MKAELRFWGELLALLLLALPVLHVSCAIGWVATMPTPRPRPALALVAACVLLQPACYEVPAWAPPEDATRQAPPPVDLPTENVEGIARDSRTPGRPDVVDPCAPVDCSQLARAYGAAPTATILEVCAPAAGVTCARMRWLYPSGAPIEPAGRCRGAGGTWAVFRSCADCYVCGDKAGAP